MLQEDKFCGKCLSCLPKEYFYQSKKYKNRLLYDCKFCRKKERNLHKDENNKRFREKYFKTVKNKTLTHDRLLSLLHYNPEKGIFRWRKDRGNGIYKGDIAGTLTEKGYVLLSIDWKTYTAHKIAWFYQTKSWSDQIIDHINRDPSDNRWCNLRLVDDTCSILNRNKSSNNTSGVTGVYWNKKNSKWTVRLSLHNKEHYFGSYENFDDAVMVRYKAEVKMKINFCNLKSSAYKYLKDNTLLE